jgi:hypothetical protein
VAWLFELLAHARPSGLDLAISHPEPEAAVPLSEGTLSPKSVLIRRDMSDIMFQSSLFASLLKLLVAAAMIEKSKTCSFAGRTMSDCVYHPLSSGRLNIANCTPALVMVRGRQRALTFKEKTEAREVREAKVYWACHLPKVKVQQTYPYGLYCELTRSSAFVFTCTLLTLSKFAGFENSSRSR